MIGIVNILLVVCLIGCSVTKQRGKHSGASAREERIEPEQIARLVFASNAGREDDHYTTYSTIRDKAFAQELFADLQRLKDIKAKRYLLVEPSLIVFLDESGKCLTSYLYWPAGNPPHIFSHRTVEADGAGYRVIIAAISRGDVTITDFDKRIQAYIDVWHP